MLEHTKRQVHKKFYNMRYLVKFHDNRSLFVIFATQTHTKMLTLGLNII